jgi:hypothetical protein
MKIDGIYDQKTIQTLIESKVQDLAFDFRPKSFNFLQQHKFLELLENNFNEKTNYFLRYSYEKDFVVQKMLDDFHEKYTTENLYLEFSDFQASKYYDSFKTPFFWHYRSDVNPIEILKSEYIRGIVIPFNLIEEGHHQGNFFSFVQGLLQLVYPFIHEKKLEIHLGVDWDSDIFPTLFDTLDIDCVSLPINNKIEICYRNVDSQKMSDHINRCRT